MGGEFVAVNINKSGNISEKELLLIKEIVESIRYGTVSLVIQDGKLIQIDKLEKVRLK